MAVRIFSNARYTNNADHLSKAFGILKLFDNNTYSIAHLRSDTVMIMCLSYVIHTLNFIVVITIITHGLNSVLTSPPPPPG